MEPRLNLVHIADKGARRQQLIAFYEKLPRTEKGRLTMESQKRWAEWLAPYGIARERAKQIMQGK